MGNKPNRLLAYLLMILALGLFMGDLLVPLGVSGYLPFIGVVLFSLWFHWRWYTYLTSAICTGLIVIGLFLSPGAEVPFWMAAVNRLLAIGGLWLAAFLGLAASRAGQLEQVNRSLQQEIRERLQAEERMRQQASLLDLTPDAIMVRDLQHCILYWSRGAELMYGWTAQEAVGQDAIALLFPGNHSAPFEALQALSDNGQWRGEFQQKTKDGRLLVVEARWICLTDERGQPQSFLVVNTDVTEKKSLQSQLLRSQRLESLGILAGGIAHDFNNLLTPILMAVKLLKKDRPEEERQHLLTTLQASAERGVKVVQQLLAFGGGAEGQRVTFQPGHVIKEIETILEHTFAKAIKIIIKLEDNLKPVHADATQLAQVLMNLCVNARDAMPEGGTLTIQAGNVFLTEDYARRHLEAQPGNYVLIAVADTGQGIPADHIDKLFDPFFSTKSTDKGTGLGLSTALGILRAHGGFINVFSEVGRGSRFTVYLPAAAAGEEVPRPKQETSGPPPGHGELVLIVDDDILILETARATLESHGYRVLTAADGHQALAQFQQYRPEIQAVLLDMMMPGLDGQATMTALAKLEPRTRIIASSGLRVSKPVKKAIAAGHGAILPKPYTDEQLLTTLAKVLAPHSLRDNGAEDEELVKSDEGER